jgi:hypothetical protein
MKKFFVILFVMCLSACMVPNTSAVPVNPVPAIEPQPQAGGCEQELQKLERLLGELKQSSQEYCFNNLRLQFLVGNSYSRLAVCQGNDKYKKLAIEAYDNALENFQKGVDIKEHQQDAIFLAEKAREHRARVAQQEKRR